MKYHNQYSIQSSILKVLVAGSCALILQTGCKKFIQIAPPDNALPSSTLFSDSGSISGALVGIYSQMNSSGSTPEINITLSGSLASDELVTNSSDYNYPFFINTIPVDNGIINDDLWVNFYKYIYSANDIIENVPSSKKITSTAKNQFIGEAKFIRAYCHFYLINLFGNIPLITTTDYRITASLPQAPIAAVYGQIISDLKDSKELLSADYVTAGKVRPNKWTVAALLARTYLYTGAYTDAETEATEIIQSGMYLPLPGLSEVFLNNSAETIWQLYPSADGIATFDGAIFIPGDPTIIPRYSISDTLLQAFETNDLRKTDWLGSQILSGTTYYFPFKYKVAISANGNADAEYIILFRLAEQYLIRAEARIHQNNISGAQEDINVVRSRAGLPDTNINGSDSLLAEVQHERQVELFAECGHRWFDLKRTGQADKMLSIIKAPNWHATDTLFPIPNGQILANPALKQNAGY